MDTSLASLLIYRRLSPLHYLCLKETLCCIILCLKEKEVNLTCGVGRMRAHTHIAHQVRKSNSCFIYEILGVVLSCDSRCQLMTGFFLSDIIVKPAHNWGENTSEIKASQEENRDGYTCQQRLRVQSLSAFSQEDINVTAKVMFTINCSSFQNSYKYNTEQIGQFHCE